MALGKIARQVTFRSAIDASQLSTWGQLELIWARLNELEPVEIDMGRVMRDYYGLCACQSLDEVRYIDEGRWDGILHTVHRRPGKQLLASTYLMPYLQVQIFPVQYFLMCDDVCVSPSTVTNFLVAFTITCTASELRRAPSATGSSPPL